MNIDNIQNSNDLLRFTRCDFNPRALTSYVQRKVKRFWKQVDIFFGITKGNII